MLQVYLQVGVPHLFLRAWGREEKFCATFLMNKQNPTSANKSTLYNKSIANSSRQTHTHACTPEEYKFGSSGSL